MYNCAFKRNPSDMRSSFWCTSKNLKKAHAPPPRKNIHSHCSPAATKKGLSADGLFALRLFVSQAPSPYSSPHLFLIYASHAYEFPRWATAQAKPLLIILFSSLLFF
eukprot:RCo001919